MPPLALSARKEKNLLSVLSGTIPFVAEFQTKGHGFNTQTFHKCELVYAKQIFICVLKRLLFTLNFVFWMQSPWF